MNVIVFFACLGDIANGSRVVPSRGSRGELVWGGDLICSRGCNVLIEVVVGGEVVVERSDCHVPEEHVARRGGHIIEGGAVVRALVSGWFWVFSRSPSDVGYMVEEVVSVVWAEA